VRLHFCKVFDWQGAFEMREAQQMAWQTLPVQVAPVLPGTVPVLRWFAAERGFSGADALDCRPWTGSTASSGTRRAWCP
jgi:8-oxo-dGTP diphosphatase